MSLSLEVVRDPRGSQFVFTGSVCPRPPCLPDHLSFPPSGTLTSEPWPGSHAVAWRRCAGADLPRNSPFSGSLRAALLPCQLQLIQPVRQLYPECICKPGVPSHRSACVEGIGSLTKGKDRASRVSREQREVSGTAVLLEPWSRPQLGDPRPITLWATQKSTRQGEEDYG